MMPSTALLTTIDQQPPLQPTAVVLLVVVIDPLSREAVDEFGVGHGGCLGCHLAPLECMSGSAYARAMSLGWKVGDARISSVTETELVYSCETFLRRPPSDLDPYRSWLAPYLSDDGRFSPTALETIRRSFVDLKILDHEPDMAKLYTEKFLP